MTSDSTADQVGVSDRQLAAIEFNVDVPRYRQ